jgi:hypothetical protein
VLHPEDMLIVRQRFFSPSMADTGTPCIPSMLRNEQVFDVQPKQREQLGCVLRHVTWHGYRYTELALTYRRASNGEPLGMVVRLRPATSTRRLFWTKRLTTSKAAVAEQPMIEYVDVDEQVPIPLQAVVQVSAGMRL